MTPRTVTVTFELNNTSLSLSDIRQILREAFEAYETGEQEANEEGDGDNTSSSGTITQIQLNVIDATKHKKA